MTCRRALGVVGAAVASLSAALALSACGHTVGLGTFALGPGPLASGAVGGRLVDVGLVRVGVPRGWSLGTGCSARTVSLSWATPTTACTASGRPAVYVVPSSATGATRHRSIGPDGVEVVLPRLHVALYGFGRTGEAVAQRAAPSALDRLLHSSLRLGVPRAWHRVAFGRASIAVPPWIRVDRLRPTRPPYVGSSDGQLFPTPLVSIGDGNGQPAIWWCFMVTTSTELAAYATPGDGVWLHHTIPVVGSLSRRPPFDSGAWIGRHPRLLRAHRVVDGTAVAITYAPAPVGDGFVEATFVVRGANVALDLGLGRDPVIAETILSSLRVR